MGLSFLWPMDIDPSDPSVQARQALFLSSSIGIRFFSKDIINFFAQLIIASQCYLVCFLTFTCSSNKLDIHWTQKLISNCNFQLAVSFDITSIKVLHNLIFCIFCPSLKDVFLWKNLNIHNIKNF